MVKLYQISKDRILEIARIISKKELPGQLLLAVPLREGNHRLDIFLIQRDVWLFPMEAFPWKNFWLK